LIGGVLYGVSFMLVKLSILVFYLQLSPHQTFRILVYLVITTTIVYSLVGSFEFLFVCKPMAKYWDLSITDGSCFSSFKILSMHGGLNIATDIAMLILPVVLVRKLHLPWRQKVALAGLFMAGTLQVIPRHAYAPDA
jgi:hypothetical protein